jgi:hypothetical protein
MVLINYKMEIINTMSAQIPQVPTNLHFYDVLPKSRNLALRAGSGKFFTGKVCKHGHLTYRYTGSGACASCANPKVYIKNFDGFVHFQQRMHPRAVKYMYDYARNMNALAHAGLL